MSVTDVNEAFFTERKGQIDRARSSEAEFNAMLADGRLRNLGNGRFRVNDPGSWDNGEILTADSSGLIMPQHGLDESRGSAALYTRVPAWHDLGNVVPAGETDIATVIRLGGADFDVLQGPVRYYAGRRLLTVPDKRVNYRSDTLAPLGIVGKDFHIIQNPDALDFLLEIVDQGEARWESCGLTKGGAHLFACICLPEDLIVDAEGIADIIRPFVAVFNGHDGSMKLTAAVTPWRPLCGNTERFAVRDAVTKWTVRHTKNAETRVGEARRTLKLAGKYFDRFAIEEGQLAKLEISTDDFVRLMDELWKPKTEPTEREKSLAATRTTAIMERFEKEVALIGSTAYAAERAITGYADNDKARKASRKYGTAMQVRATAALEGGDDTLKSAAHRRLMALAA